MTIKKIIKDVSAATISFTAPDLINDSGNGLGVFSVGDKITVDSGTNDGVYTVASVTAGQIEVVEQTILTEGAGAFVLTSNLNSEWVPIDHLDLRSGLLPSIAGVGTWGGGTLKLEVSFEADQSNPFLIGTGLTANGIETDLPIAGAKYARLDLAGATAPDLVVYMGF